MNRIQNVIRAIVPTRKKKVAGTRMGQQLTSRDICTNLTMMTAHARAMM